MWSAYACMHPAWQPLPVGKRTGTAAAGREPCSPQCGCVGAPQQGHQQQVGQAFQLPAGSWVAAAAAAAGCCRLSRQRRRWRRDDGYCRQRLCCIAAWLLFPLLLCPSSISAGSAAPGGWPGGGRPGAPRSWLCARSDGMQAILKCA